MPVGAGFIPARIGENKKMTEHKKLQPEIRFAGFTDDWEQRKLGEVVNVLDNLRIPIAASQRLEGVTPYYGANGIQGYIDGFTHDGEFVLVAEDGANDLINYPVQYVSGKVWINNHAHVLQGIKNVANNLFLVYRIKSMDMTKYLVGGGRTKLNASVMKDIELHLPNYAEQTQIGNFFKQLDDTIALHQRTLEKYQKLKISYLEKMFPKGNELYPELRFPNFTDAWEQRKLGEIVDVFDGTHQTPKYTDKGIMFLSVEDIKTLKSEKYISEEDFKKEFKYFPEIGDVLMTRIGDVGTTNVICSTQPIAYYVSLALLKNKNSDPYFLSTVISSGSVQSDIWKRTLHIAFPKKINKSEIEKVIIPLPSYVEQTQIGNFFKQLDDTIALHQREVEKYKKIKQSYLEKMFI